MAERFRAGNVGTRARLQAGADRRAARQVKANERRDRLNAAAQQFINPQLSGQQSGAVTAIGGGAAAQGIFGNAVAAQQEQVSTQFVAGNRLAGLSTLADDFLNFAPRGVSRSDQERNNEVANATLAQVAALETQFRFGGRSGVKGVAELDPNSFGDIRRRSRAQDLFAKKGGLLGGLRQSGFLSNQIFGGANTAPQAQATRNRANQQFAPALFGG